MNEQLSKYFSKREMIRSSAADRLKINNEPNAEQLQNLKNFCLTTMDAIRDHFNRPIIITSGFRCPELNKAIGGEKDSEHQFGFAADFELGEPYDRTLNSVFMEISVGNIPFTQVIYEFGWIHISNNPNKQTKTCSIAYRQDGKIKYQHFYKINEYVDAVKHLTTEDTSEKHAVRLSGFDSNVLSEYHSFLDFLFTQAEIRPDSQR